ncbi:hypothetical protein NL676_014894 [Syzygium grande]|nr:hypothetical protein NL676_014894 [Syzygium grande]
MVAAPAPSNASEASALLHSVWWPRFVTGNTSLPHCAWPGVWCDASGSVNRIHLTTEYQTGGNFSNMNFSLLPSLTFLQLFYTGLTGEIPLQICTLSRLTLLDLSYNSLTVVGSCFLFGRATKKVQPEATEKNGNILSIWNYDGRIAYEDIINATEDFDLKYCIGTGGYGSVYIARLPNGKVVALKKLHRLEAEDPPFDNSFRNKVKHLTEVRNKSIIKLHGFCLHRRCMFLVY